MCNTNVSSQSVYYQNLRVASKKRVTINTFLKLYEKINILGIKF